MLDPGHENLNEEFERQMRAALSPRPAPEGFADRVMARLGEGSGAQADGKLRVFTATGSHSTASFRPAHTHWPRPQHRHLSWARSGIAAALLVTLMLGGYLEHRRQQRIAGERARQQVLLAFRIAGTTLQEVRIKADKGYFHRNITQDEREP